jgi:hypothetical protein
MELQEMRRGDGHWRMEDRESEFWTEKRPVECVEIRREERSGSNTYHLRKVLLVLGLSILLSRSLWFYPP